MKFLGLVWSNLKRKKLRTSLTLLSIFVAFFLFGLLSTIRESFSAGVALAGQDRIIVRHKVSLILSLPESYRARIARIPGIESVVPFTWFGGNYIDETNFFAQMPTDPEPFLDMYPEFLLPEDQKQAWLNTRTGAIAGRQLANRFDWKVGQKIQMQSPIWLREGDAPWEFDIVGIFEGKEEGTDTSGFYFRHDYLEEGRIMGKGEIGWFAVRISDPDRAPEIAAAIDAEFANSAYETKAEPEGAFMQGFAQQIGDIGTIMIAVVSAVFFTILLVAGNTMAQAVRERTVELGVLKAIGFTNGRVLALVLIESTLIAVVGGLPGIGAAWLYTTFVGSPDPASLPVFYFPTRDAMIGVGLAFALGLGVGVAPAIQAMRLQVAVALRREA